MGPEGQDGFQTSTISTQPGGDPVEVRYERCPDCGASPISPQRYMYVLSFLFFTRHAIYEMALCRRCATRQGLTELAKSALFGWWGIPWGLLTLRALWIDTRSLMRWSALGWLLAALAGAAGLSLPVALGFYFYHEEQTKTTARATGDWVDKDVADLVAKGQQEFSEDRMEEALVDFTEAHRRAPGSGAVNNAMAQVLIALGHPEQALPYAAEAARFNPGSVFIAASYGLLLVGQDDMDAARTVALRLHGKEPGGMNDAWVLTQLFDNVGEPDQQLRTAEAGLRFEPSHTYLQCQRVHALLLLGRRTEAVESLGRIESADEDPYPRFLKVLSTVEDSPREAMDELIVDLQEEIWPPRWMDAVVQAMQRAGALEASRERMASWLQGGSAPPDAWQSVRPWFDDRRWNEELDAYLATHTEVVPALLRLISLDEVEDTGRILRIAGAVRSLPHPLASRADGSYFGALVIARPMEVALQELGEHVAEQPSHLLCRFHLGTLMLDSEPDAAIGHLSAVAEQATTDPALRQAAEIFRLEAEVSRGNAESVVGELQRIPSDAAEPYVHPEDLDFVVAQAAFGAGRVHLLDDRLKAIGRAEEPGTEGAALILRWGQQVCLGLAPTYRADVDGLWKHYGESLKQVQSPSLQGMLVAEGIVTREQARHVVGWRGSDTFDLVVAMKHLGDGGASGGPELERIASSPHRSFASWVARRIVSQTIKTPSS